MALTDNLVAYWKFDNNGNDSVGTNHLTATSGAFAGGKVGDAASFAGAGSGDDWGVASNTAVQMGDIDWTVAGWFMMEVSKDSYRVLVSKENGTDREYLLYYNLAADRFTFEVLNGASTSIGAASASTFGSPSLSVWYYIFAYHSATDNQVGISVNNGTVDTSATSGAAGTNGIEFVIGDRASRDLAHIGRIDEVGLWKRKLSAGEVTELYNSGNGLSYPFGVLTLSPSFRINKLRPGFFKPGLAR